MRLRADKGAGAQDALCKAQLADFLRELFVASRRYKDELLAATLELLLSAPQSLLPAQVRAGL